MHKGSVQKKIAEKETLVHVGGRGIKKSPFFGSSKRGHILMGGALQLLHSLYMKQKPNIFWI